MINILKYKKYFSVTNGSERNWFLIPGEYIFLKRKGIAKISVCSRFSLLRFARHTSSLQGNAATGAKTKL